MIASWTGVCPACGGWITQGNANPDVGPIHPPSQVVKVRGDWVHAYCAPGADDE